MGLREGALPVLQLRFLLPFGGQRPKLSLFTAISLGKGLAALPRLPRKVPFLPAFPTGLVLPRPSTTFSASLAASLWGCPH